MKISDILEKIGVQGIDQLTAEEKATFQKWQVILSKPDASLDELKKLLPAELERAYAELRKHGNSIEKDAYYKAYTSLLDFISRAIFAPQKERENLQSFLKQKYKLD